MMSVSGVSQPKYILRNTPEAIEDATNFYQTSSQNLDFVQNAVNKYKVRSMRRRRPHSNLNGYVEYLVQIFKNSSEGARAEALKPKGNLALPRMSYFLLER